jgi:16S rRNA G966 N2-methylase RsmD
LRELQPTPATHDRPGLKTVDGIAGFGFARMAWVVDPGGNAIGDRRYLPDAAVDLVYLDPPFHSNRDDNVIGSDESGKTCDAQLLAFEDTWHA